MLVNPRIGQQVVIHYRKSNQHLPYQGKVGRVVIRSHGKPRNHLIDIDGMPVVIPCGNINKGGPCGSPQLPDY